MKKYKKIIVSFFVIEMLVVAFYFYNQPLCEPCIPGTSCPPCVSESQIVARWIGFSIAIVTICYFVIENLVSKKKFIDSQKKV